MKDASESKGPLGEDQGGRRVHSERGHHTMVQTPYAYPSAPLVIFPRLITGYWEMNAQNQETLQT